MAPLSWQIGDARVTRIVEREVSLPTVHLIPEATPEALAPHAHWLAPHFLDDPEGTCTFTLSIHGLVVESQGRRILVDTCSGDKEAPGFESMTGGSPPFLEDLEAAGFAPDTIDTVLCTHMHFDHVGWNTRREGDRWVPAFANARYLFARLEWEHWSQGGDPTFVPTMREAVEPIFDAGLADLVETDHPLTDEVRLEATPGHTPGHVSVRIASGDAEAIITGDLTHHPVQWAEPHWKMRADSDSGEAARTRLRLIEEHADSATLVIGTHYAAPCAGHIVRHADGHRFDTKRRA